MAKVRDSRGLRCWQLHLAALEVTSSIGSSSITDASIRSVPMLCEDGELLFCSCGECELPLSAASPSAALEGAELRAEGHTRRSTHEDIIDHQHWACINFSIAHH
jgi:hypothetical protein